MIHGACWPRKTVRHTRHGSSYSLRLSLVWLGLMLVAALVAPRALPGITLEEVPKTQRALLALSLQGAQGSLLCALAVVSLSIPLGAVLGGFSAGGSRWLDFVLSRLVECCGLWPTVMLVGFFRLLFPSDNGIYWVASLGLIRAAHLGRLVRSEALRLNASEFVLAARALGVGSTRLVTYHVLPHLTGLLLSHAALAGAWAVALEAGLAMAGLGLPGGLSWGTVLAKAGELGLGGTMTPLLATAFTTLALGIIADAVDEMRTVRHGAATAPIGPLRTRGAGEVRPSPPTPEAPR